MIVVNTEVKTYAVKPHNGVPMGKIEITSKKLASYDDAGKWIDKGRRRVTLIVLEEGESLPGLNLTVEDKSITKFCKVCSVSYDTHSLETCPGCGSKLYSQRKRP